MSIEVGSALEVQLEGFTVATGTVTEISEGQVYIDIPATRVVMGLKQSLGEPPVREPEVEHQFIGTNVPSEDGGSPAQDAVNAPAEQVNDTNVTNVPPPNPEMAQPQQQITMSNESLRNQQLDSSVLD